MIKIKKIFYCADCDSELTDISNHKADHTIIEESFVSLADLVKIAKQSIDPFKPFEKYVRLSEITGEKTS